MIETAFRVNLLVINYFPDVSKLFTNITNSYLNCFSIIPASSIHAMPLLYNTCIEFTISAPHAWT